MRPSHSSCLRHKGAEVLQHASFVARYTLCCASATQKVAPPHVSTQSVERIHQRLYCGVQDFKQVQRWWLPDCCSEAEPDIIIMLTISTAAFTITGHADCKRQASVVITSVVTTMLMAMHVLCSAKALSKYTEMVDNLIRQQKDKLEAASDEARLRLREWDMPEALQVPVTCISLWLSTAITVMGVLLQLERLTPLNLAECTVCCTSFTASSCYWVSGRAVAVVLVWAAVAACNFSSGHVCLLCVCTAFATAAASATVPACVQQQSALTYRF